MQRTNSKTAMRQILAQARCRPLGAAENNGAASPSCLQNTADDFHLVHRVHAVNDLLDCAHRGALILRVLRADVGRLGHEAASQRHYRARHRR